MHKVSIPAVGFAMTEGLLVRWLKEPGDPVEAGEPVAEIETDKAIAELEAPASGILGRHRFPVGTAVPVGVPLAMILEIGESEEGDEPPRADAVAENRVGDVQPDTGADTVTNQMTAVEAERPHHHRTPRERAAALLEDAHASTADEVRDERGPARRGGIRVTDTADTHTLLPIALDGVPDEKALGWLRRMLLIREFETRCEPLALAGKIAGGVHSSLGQEAVAVGVATALQGGDHVTGTHRSHHHALAMGIPPTDLMAELFGRASGCNGGRGGSMHVADVRRGFIGGNGIVGAGVGLAMGAALSAKVRGTGQVAVGFVGDGGVNTGRTWESVNLAAVWKLPLLVVCENNLYAVETTTATVTASESIARRAEGFGIRTEVVDGQDIVAVHLAATAAIERARAGDGPTFIEARTYRYEGHNTGQAITYRTANEVSDWRSHRDPIARLRAALTDRGALDHVAYDALAAETTTLIDGAVAYADGSPWPEAAAALRGVTALGETVRRLS